MWLAKLFEVGVKVSKVSGTVRPAKPIRMIQHVRQKRQPKEALVCKKLRQSHRIQTVGSQTSTRTPKLILRVTTRAGKGKTLLAQFVMFFNFSGYLILIAHNQ